MNSQDITMVFIDTINGHDFKTSDPKKRKELSLKILLGIKDRSQSFLIQAGSLMEKCFNNFLQQIPEVKLLNNISESDRQIDIGFEYKNKKSYFELKSNYDFDTEKCRSVVDKIEKMKEYDCCGVLVYTMESKKWYECQKKYIMCKNKNLEALLYGYNDFFALFETKIQETDFDRIIGTLLKKWEEFKD